MSLQDEEFALRNGVANGHGLLSLIARGEPEHHRNKALADLAAALPTPEAFKGAHAAVDRLVTTPDFHPGKPIPVGVVADVRGAVLPHMVGNDIGCGMRMLVLPDVLAEELTRELEGHLRHVFFQGGRDIALTGRSRHAILRDGLPGLIDSLSVERRGLLAKLDLRQAWSDLDRTADAGVFAAMDIDPDFAEYAMIDDHHRHDAILGTVGGGNHFVEFGVVGQIVDHHFARLAGLRQDAVVVVVHSGSLDFGQRVGSAARDRAARPNGQGRDPRILSEATDEKLMHRYLLGHANAVNAAFANRFLLGLAAVEAVSRTVQREISHELVYDAPHNAIWSEGGYYRHRKGACTARGPGRMPGNVYDRFGEPIILPGSMGDGTWLLRANEVEGGVESSAHGAGRKLSRSEARNRPSISSSLRVVGPVDLKAPELRGRFDVLRELDGRLREEAPAAYRSVDAVAEPMIEAGWVSRVARVHPILTVKG